VRYSWPKYIRGSRRRIAAAGFRCGKRLREPCAPSEGRSLARQVTILLQAQLTAPKKYKIRDWPKLAGGLWKGNEVEKFLEEERRW
jgi:hypothetical protein